ncbi:Bacteriophage KVP40, Orf299 [uncultured Caudovirales phage]|uniref:Bacteriophage KVP40, Orf299 n=1 Tax=uncultured Caudovirales phage TaxID=2100421 RepID=A0A6J5NW15_9CAUD|nr:Bacteriophage KVP40, Orf299 [uncultured Caudovirales phage]
MRAKLNLEEVKEFIRNTSDATSIYIGADSERYRKGGEFWADYTVAIVIHHDSSRGCKVFGEVTTDRDYDQKKNRPAYRLMNEVYRAAQMYLDLADAIGDRHCELHLDVNPDLMHGSSCVLNQAIGYIRGTCNVTPKVKPEAFAASYCADRLKEILNVC